MAILISSIYPISKEAMSKIEAGSVEQRRIADSCGR